MCFGVRAAPGQDTPPAVEGIRFCGPSTAGLPPDQLRSIVEAYSSREVVLDLFFLFDRFTLLLLAVLCLLGFLRADLLAFRMIGS